MVFWILWIIVTPFLLLFMPTRIIGKKHIKKIKKQGAILACNHQSIYDAFILKTQVKPGFKMMAKEELFKSKFTAWLMTRLGAYPVKRGASDISAVKKTLGYLKDNKQIVIFPEGTRGKTGDLSELKNGLVMFALRTDCYVVPAIFRKKPRWFTFNTLLIDKPFKFSDFEDFKGVKPDHDLLEKASKILSDKMQYLKDVKVKDFKKEIKKTNY